MLLLTAFGKNAIIVLPPTPGDHSVCINTTKDYGVVLHAGLTYAWSITPNTGFTLTPNPTYPNLITVTWTTAGTYTMQVIETNAEGCVGDPVTIVITVNPLPTVTVNSSTGNSGDNNSNTRRTRHLHLCVDSAAGINERTAHDRVAIHKTPIAAVPTTVAIISHYEITIRWDDKTAAVDIIEQARGPLRPQATFEKIAARGRKVVTEGIRAEGIVDNVRLLEWLAIDVDALIDDPEAIAGQADDAFHVVRMIVKGKLENDNVAAANGTVRKKFFVPRAAPFEDEFVH